MDGQRPINSLDDGGYSVTEWKGQEYVIKCDSAILHFSGRFFTTATFLFITCFTFFALFDSRTTVLDRVTQTGAQHTQAFGAKDNEPVNSFTRFGTGYLSSTLPGVMHKDRISPWSLTITCHLKP